MAFAPSDEASTSREESCGSLLSPQAMGGLRGGRGYDAERDYILARLHKWLSQPDFCAIQVEGLTEIELAFEDDGGQALVYIQIKDHPVDLPKGRDVIMEFFNREQTPTGPQYRKYILASDSLVGDMRRIHDAITRYRRSAIYTQAEKAPTLVSIDELLEKLRIHVPAQFLVDKVYFDTDGEWLKTEELRRSLFETRLVSLLSYRLNTERADRVYTELLARIELSRGETILRSEIEEIIHAEQLQLPMSAIALDSSDVIRYAKALQTWATAYQEEVIGWGGVYTPLQIKRLPIHVMHLPGSRSRLDTDSPQGVLEAIRTHRKLVLVGDPGSGKTTTALKVAYDQAERLKADASLPIPVVVPLRELAPSVDLITLIRDSLARHGLYLELAIIGSLVFSSGRLYVILEGVNEIGRAARRAGVDADLSRVVHTAQGGVLVTTRREGYDPQLFQGLPALEILPLSRIGVETFLREHFPGVAEQLNIELKSPTHEKKLLRGSLFDLARNPLLLTLLAVVYRDCRELPSNLGELLEAFSTHIIHRESQKGSQFPSAARTAILEHIAATMLRAGRRVSLDRLSLQSVVAQALDELKQDHYVRSEITVTDVLDEVDRRVFRFLRSTLDKRTIEWEHHLFQEYYAASWLRRTLLIIERPERCLAVLRETVSLEWVEPLRMLVGILADDQAVTVVRMLLHLDPLLGADAFQAARSTVQDELKVVLLNALDRALQDEDPNVRQEAARALGRLVGTLAAPMLFLTLGDADYRVRHEAAQSLDRIALKSLEQLDLPDRRQIRQELRQRGNYIEQICNEQDSLVLRWGIWLLAEMVRIRSVPDRMRTEALQAVEAGLYVPDPPTRFAAARTMARIGYPGLAVLAELTLTGSGEIRESARAVFGRISPGRCITVLVDLAAGHTESLVQERAQQRLADYGEDAARAALKALDRALQEKNSEAAQGLISALGIIGGTGPVECLIRLLDLSEPGLCTAAAVALGYSGDDRAIAPLVGLLRCQNLPTERRSVWQGAARGLMLLGQAALPSVVDFAQWELAEPGLVPLVLDILANASAHGIQPLAALLVHQQPQIRAEAARRLGWLRAIEVTGKLRPLLADPSASVRGAAIGALYAIEGTQSVSAILPLLDDPSAIVREEAARALKHEHKHDAVLRALASHLNDDAVNPYARNTLLAVGGSATPLLLEQIAEPASRAVAHQLLVDIGLACVEPLKAILDDAADPRRSEVPAILAEILGEKGESLIQPLLQDESKRVRLAALEALLSLDSPKTEGIVVDAMGDPAAAVRRLATREARRWTTPSIARALVARLCDRDAEVCRAAMLSLRESGSLAVAELVALATGRASRAQDAARDVLVSLDRKVLSDLVEMLQTTHRPKVVSLASDLLCAMGLPAFKALLPLLDSDKEKPRRRAAEILARNKQMAISAIVGHLRKIPELSDGLRSILQPLDLETMRILANELSQANSKNDTIAKAIIRRILNRLTGENESRIIFEMMLDHREYAVRQDLFCTLAETGYLSVQRLERIARSSRVPACNYALEALGWVGTPEALGIVGEAIDPSRSVRIRQTACRVLVEARAAVCMPALISALDDSDTEVRRLVAQGLGNFEDVRVVDALMPAAGDPTPEVRSAVIGSLGKIGHVGAFGVLRERLYCDKDPDVACAAASALGKIPHPEAPPVLLQTAFDDHPIPVKIAAAKALSHKHIHTVESLLLEYLACLDDTTSLDFDLLKHIGLAATPTFLLALEHPSELVRLRGLNALSAVGDPRAQQAVIALAQESLQALASSDIMVAICKALGAFGGKQAVPVLDQLQRAQWHWKDGQRIVEAAAAAKEQIKRRL